MISIQQEPGRTPGVQRGKFVAHDVVRVVWMRDWFIDISWRMRSCLTLLGVGRLAVLRASWSG